MNCTHYSDYYYNISVIDSGISGPVVIVDIVINDCDMKFDNWLVERMDNVLDIANRWQIIQDQLDDQWYEYYDLYRYYAYYGPKYGYPEMTSDYVPPGLWFVYQYNSDNKGIVKTSNSQFIDNYNFAIVTCCDYSYCNIEMSNCTFKNNILKINDSVKLYNVIWMTDNSYGRVLIEDSLFIGDYTRQEGGESDSWVLDENENVSFDCVNCQFIQSFAPTLVPTDPTAEPSMYPTGPTLIPTAEPTAVLWSETFILNPDSGTNRYNGSGSCSLSSPCSDLDYAIQIVNGMQEDSNNVTISMISDFGSSTQKWNTTFIVDEQATNLDYLSNYRIVGEGAGLQL